MLQRYGLAATEESGPSARRRAGHERGTPTPGRGAGLLAALDPALERMMGFATGLRIRDPIRWTLAPHRREAMRKVQRELAPRAARLAPRVITRDPEAVRAFDALCDDAIARMRAERAGGSRVVDAASALERPLYRQREERMDDPTLPAGERAEAIWALHRLNEHLGSYDAFAELVAPLVGRAEAAGSRPVVVHDLAAGHAGFAVFLKRKLGARARLEASDIVPEYLELGRAHAAAAGVDVELLVQDALDLEPLARRGADVITCTQALHHFPPGMVARMIGEAARAARAGVCFVDGERSWLSFAFITSMAALYGRTYTLVHDAAVSVRRMFYEEELALLAALAPGMPESARLECGFAFPAHAYVRVTCGRAAEQQAA